MLKRLSIIGTVMAIVVLMAVSPAVAAKRGTDRPFKADLAGEVTFDLFGPEALDLCGDYLGVLTHTELTGNASHMGRSQASSWHCPTDIGHDNGHLMLTAANGDKIYFEYVDDGTTGNSFPMHIVDGTGRFADAAGTVMLYYWLEPAMTPEGNPDFFSPWGWWGTIEGTISY
jgi:hypothetical protein